MTDFRNPDLDGLIAKLESVPNPDWCIRQAIVLLRAERNFDRPTAMLTQSQEWESSTVGLASGRAEAVPAALNKEAEHVDD